MTTTGRLKRPWGSLHFEVVDLTPPWGGDPPVLVFHHGVGTDAGIWSAWLPALADRYRLVRFDMAGFGRSSVPGPGHAWSLGALAEDTLAVAAAAGASRFHLAGESLGGTVGLYLAAHHPAAVTSLAVCNASHRGGSIQRVQEWRQFIGRQGMAAWSAMMMGLRFDAGQLPEPMWAWFERTQAAASADSVLDLADLLVGTDLGADLGRIVAPTIFLAPARSPFVPLEIMREMHRLVPDSELLVFAGARHGLPFSHGAACARALRDFLDRRGLA